MLQKWVAPLDPQYIASGTALASSTTLTDVSPAPNKLIPANFLLPGMRIKVRAACTFSNTSTPTLLTGVYYGGVAGTALAATSAITTTTGATNWPINIWYEGTVRTIGATGTIMGYGFIDLATSLTAFTHRPIPETALATVAIDTTTSKAITLGAQWGTNSASNTLTCVDFTVEIA
jgi:hypothetical protein